jgi:NAD+ synthetase
MNIHNEQSGTALLPELRDILSRAREGRRFDSARVAHDKAQRLNEYLSAFGLKSCVVGVSGGVDSAVVLGLVALAAKLPHTPIQRIIPVLLPVFTPGFATGQDSATLRGIEVCHAFGVPPVELNLSQPFDCLKETVESAFGAIGSGWAGGQLVAYTRTPALYYLTSLLSEAGTPGVLVGTTNKDEGAYLGYFGKASDGLVDIQLISDLHKSEVFALARELGVPSSIQQITPTGDMYDGRVDEEVFGAPYDFVEMFLQSLAAPEQWNLLIEGVSSNAQNQFKDLSLRLEALHRYNKHKYLGKSPAVHLDLLDARIPGGWDYFIWTPSCA